MMECLHGSKMMMSYDPFPVTNGAKQGCVLAPTLFSMMFSAMLTAAFQDGDNVIPIRYHFDGKLFNQRRLQAKSKVQTEVLDESLFADDMAKDVPTEEKMPKGVDQVSDSCDSYDLTISIKKTEVVFCTFVRFALVWFCLFPLSLGVFQGLRIVICTPWTFLLPFFTNQHLTSLTRSPLLQ